MGGSEPDQLAGFVVSDSLLFDSLLANVIGEVVDQVKLGGINPQCSCRQVQVTAQAVAPA
jgi:hypothetical protein